MTGRIDIFFVELLQTSVRRCNVSCAARWNVCPLDPTTSVSGEFFGMSLLLLKHT